MKQGFSVVEILLGMGLLAVVVLLFTRGYNSFTTNSATNSKLEDAVYQSLAAADLIERVGKVAVLCQRVVVAAVHELRCRVDLTRPSSGVLTWVRFIPVGNDLLYQSDSGGGTFLAANVTTKERFPGVTGFQVCIDADMNFAGGGICTIEPLEMSNVHTAYVGAKAGRFFRFILSGTTTVNADAIGRFAQGAFFVRNPPTWAPANTTYGW